MLQSIQLSISNIAIGNTFLTIIFNWLLTAVFISEINQIFGFSITILILEIKNESRNEQGGLE